MAWWRSFLPFFQEIAGGISTSLAVSGSAPVCPACSPTLSCPAVTCNVSAREGSSLLVWILVLAFGAALGAAGTVWLVHRAQTRRPIASAPVKSGKAAGGRGVWITDQSDGN